MNGSFDISTLVFAILAIFVVWKLRSVLGQRTGADRPPTDPFAKRGAPDPTKPGAGPDMGKVIPLPGAASSTLRGLAPIHPDRWTGFAQPGTPVAAGLDEIAKADPNFAADQFMAGARLAYEAIIMAFAKGDKPTLSSLLAKDVYDGFATAIDQRNAKGETVETTFVALDTAVIEDAQVRGRSAQMTLRFETKLITVTRDKEGTVVDGNAEAVADIIDHWTFAREIASRDPNWRLVATEAGQ
jgi:predicted lipid-binding transport protein (Tim44 family)